MRTETWPLPTSHLPNMQVWHHRQWVMEWGGCTWQHPVDLKLTAKLLMMDERNFHCWTYRRFVARAGCTPCTARATATRDGTGPWQQLAQVALLPDPAPARARGTPDVWAL